MSNGNSLGALIATHRYDPDQRKVTLVVGLGFLGLSLAFPLLYWMDPDAVGDTVWLAPVFFVGGLATLAHWVYTGRISLRIHEGGLVHRGRYVPFARVRGLRYKLVHVIGGEAAHNRGFCELRLDDGSKVRVHMQLEDMSEVIGELIGHTMPLIQQGITSALDSGQSVTCGPFQLHPEGVVCKGQSVPWARVAFSTSGVDATMQLLDVDPDSGDYKKVHSAKLADVENSNAVEVIAAERRAAAIRARAR